MRWLIPSILLVFLFVPTLQADDTDDVKAIKETAFNYMDSWYQGDSKRMKASLHKKLAKRSLRYLTRDKRDLGYTKASEMVTYTKGGIGKGLWWDGLNIDVVVLDFYKNIATVRVITPHYYEYLHLAKLDKNWVIINALYDTNTPTSD